VGTVFPQHEPQLVTLFLRKDPFDCPHVDGWMDGWMDG